MLNYSTFNDEDERNEYDAEDENFYEDFGFGSLDEYYEAFENDLLDNYDS